jgi:MoaA/NifB/PqqE/SkfB family radical SAM enzyme
MRGEPTLNPKAPEIIATLRRSMPQAQMSMFTNGTTWLKDGDEIPASLFNAGLNILNVDCYNNTYDRFQGKASTFAQRYDVELSDFRKLSAYSKIPRGYKRRIINLVPDIADPGRLVQVRKIHNMAGNLSAEQEERFGIPHVEPGSVKKRCGRPFRELAILADGRIVVCCLDWSAKDVIGTVQEGIEEAWYGDRHHRIMVALYEKRREHGACARCTYDGGMRLGLLRNPTTGASYRDKTPARV